MILIDRDDYFRYFIFFRYWSKDKRFISLKNKAIGQLRLTKKKMIMASLTDVMTYEKAARNGHNFDN